MASVEEIVSLLNGNADPAVLSMVAQILRSERMLSKTKTYVSQLAHQEELENSIVALQDSLAKFEALLPAYPLARDFVADSRHKFEVVFKSLREPEAHTLELPSGQKRKSSSSVSEPATKRSKSSTAESEPASKKSKSSSLKQ